MPIMHAREKVVREAELELRTILLKSNWSKELTDLERIMTVREVLSDVIANYFRYQLRMERHNDPNKPAGLA